ncbi:MAG: amino acid-binding protein [Actinobacteria bacterium]|nr:amino acid-binding protein [Actinomycetota bacterium]
MPWDLTIELPNQPGTLADVAEQLAAARINIEGVAAVPVGAHSEVHFLVDEPGEARQVLEESGIPVLHDREVLVIDCPDRPGELAARARALGNAGINIDILYIATRTRLVIGVVNVTEAAAALPDA